MVETIGVAKDREEQSDGSSKPFGVVVLRNIRGPTTRTTSSRRTGRLKSFRHGLGDVLSVIYLSI